MKIRTTKPEKGNKYYTRTSSGGYSLAVKGKPTDVCDVLSNCVGYANGRFAEIIGKDKIEYQLVCNAENFIEKAKGYGLEISNVPTLGGIMVWQKGATLNGSDGAGHVAIVERIDSANQIYTSESGYNSSAFWNSKRTNSNGRWGSGSAYKFRGCIVNPAIGKITAPVEPTSDVIAVDGVWGPSTTKKAQKVFGTTVDGIVSNQYSTYKSSNPGLSSSTFEWESKPGSNGSSLIKAIQKQVGIKQDGFIGPNTIKAMQKWLGTTVDGKVSRPSQMVKAFQKWLNTK